MKSEPNVYGYDDLVRDGKTPWDGVRNYQARNSMRDDMAPGDWVLFYHSNAKPMGVAGIARVCSAPYPDPTQFDADSRYHDPASNPDDPRWFMVDIEPVEKLCEVLPLAKLKTDTALATMLVVQKGQRLSVQPVDKKHFQRVLTLAKAKTSLR
jgi:predicted RNA-binding protein with PUA-like domain